MPRRDRAFLTFVRYFVHYTLYVREVLVSFVVLILLGGFAISRLERIELGDAIYFAFITGVTIGYGDITPETVWGRVVSVAIGLVGVVFTGLTVAVATHAQADTVRGEPGGKR